MTLSREQMRVYALGAGLDLESVSGWRPAELIDLICGLEPWPSCGGVYAVAGVSGWVKIGRAQNIAARIGRLQGGSPVPLRLLAVLSERQDDEHGIHRRFHDSRCEGEWFRSSLELFEFIVKTRAIPDGPTERAMTRLQKLARETAVTPLASSLRGAV